MSIGNCENLRVKELCFQLAHDEYSIREQAQRELVALGNIAELKLYINDPHPEIRNRVAHIIYYLSQIDLVVDMLPLIWELPTSERYNYDYNADYQSYDNDLAKQFYDEAYLAKYEQTQGAALEDLLGYIFAFDPNLRINYYHTTIGKEATLNFLRYKRWNGSSMVEINEIIAKMRDNTQNAHHVKYREVYYYDLQTWPSVLLSTTCQEGKF